MKASEIFSLVIRCTGLFLSLYALFRLYPVVFWVIPGVALGYPLAAAFWGIPSLALGLWLLRGAPAIVSFSYPAEQQKETH
jgi:hypothetical protein